MSSTIIVPLDGSPLAERALPYAAALARAGGGSLVLVRAVPFLARPTEETPGQDAFAARDAAAREARAQLRAIAGRLTEAGLAAEAVVRYADAAEAILTEARERGADLIAMATHGRGGLGRWVYGSVAEEVLATASTPILLVRAWHGAAPGAILEAGAIVLVPLDGSALAEAALPLAEQLADDLGGALLLLRAVPRPGLDFGPDALVAPLLAEELAAEETAARNYLERMAGRFARRGRIVRTVALLGEPAAAIEAAGREHGAGLVVMATHGLTGLRRAALGSVADGVVRRGSLPVLLVRPPAAGA